LHGLIGGGATIVALRGVPAGHSVEATKTTGQKHVRTSALLGLVDGTKGAATLAAASGVLVGRHGIASSFTWLFP
jgi:hypothetical protein